MCAGVLCAATLRSASWTIAKGSLPTPCVGSGKVGRTSRGQAAMMIKCLRGCVLPYSAKLQIWERTKYPALIKSGGRGRGSGIRHCA